MGLCPEYSEQDESLFGKISPQIKDTISVLVGAICTDATNAPV